MDGHFDVSLLRLDMHWQMEKLLYEMFESRNHIRVFLANAEAQTFRVKRTVAHEVADQFRELRRNGARHHHVVIARPIEFAERRQLHEPRLADQRVHRQWHNVAFRNIGETLPHPFATVRIDDSNSVLQGPLYLVTPCGADAARWRDAV